MFNSNRNPFISSNDAGGIQAPHVSSSIAAAAAAKAAAAAAAAAAKASVEAPAIRPLALDAPVLEQASTRGLAAHSRPSLPGSWYSSVMQHQSVWGPARQTAGVPGGVSSGGAVCSREGSNSGR